jgi:hypothetical protein
MPDAESVVDKNLRMGTNFMVERLLRLAMAPDRRVLKLFRINQSGYSELERAPETSGAAKVRIK